MDEPRVTLFSRTDCHLCDDARALVRDVCEELGVGWREVDVDQPVPDGTSPVDELGDLVPVVVVDGREVAHWRVDAELLRRALGGRPAAS